MIFKPKEMIGIIDLRSLGCNKYKSVTKYISVFAPGTLGIYQILIWSQLAIGS